MCKVCGGPNHHGCGCEAKAAREWPGEDAPPGGQPESETPAPDKADENMFSPFTEEALKQDLESRLQMGKDVKRMADGWEGLCALMYDTNNYLKLIAGDVITIRKFLNKEDTGTEPQDAT